MSGKTWLRSSLIILCATFLLFTTTTGAFAEKRSSGLRQAAPVEYSHKCDVPYNIEISGYTTGLHIVTDWTGDVIVRFEFYSGGTAYATVTKTISPVGWTGLASDLLPAGVALRFPTLIMALSHKDVDYPGDTIPFWVTQFLFTDFGFSHQTFTSSLYTEGSVLY